MENSMTPMGGRIIARSARAGVPTLIPIPKSNPRIVQILGRETQPYNRVVFVNMRTFPTLDNSEYFEEFFNVQTGLTENSFQCPEPRSRGGSPGLSRLFLPTLRDAIRRPPEG